MSTTSTEKRKTAVSTTSTEKRKTAVSTTSPATPATRKNAAALRKARAQAQAASTKIPKSPISAAGLDAVQAELDQLKTVRRPVTLNAVTTAREEGDLRENAGYHAAREELGMIDGRIKELEQLIKNSVVTDTVIEDSSIVRLGSTVTLDLDGEEVTYTIVGAQEAQPRLSKISTVSPVGGALLGHAVGDEFEIPTPGTTLRAVIKDVRVVR